MRNYWLERYNVLTIGEEPEPLNLNDGEIFFHDEAGIGCEVEVNGAPSNGQYIITGKSKATKSPSGTIEFLNEEVRKKFLDYCLNTNEILRLCRAKTYVPGHPEVLKLDVVLVSCERAETKANGRLECPVTFQALGEWYKSRNINMQEYTGPQEDLDLATFPEQNLILISDHKETEASLEIGYAGEEGGMGVYYDTPQIGLVTYDARGDEIERIKKCSPISMSANKTLEINSNINYLGVHAVSWGQGDAWDKDNVYQQTGNHEATPFIKTNPKYKTYLFLRGGPYSVKVRCKDFENF